MQTLLAVIQVILSILLPIVVLTQQKGTGLSATFGGGAGGAGFHATKRGAEKFLHNATVILSVLFVLNSLLFLFV